MLESLSAAVLAWCALSLGLAGIVKGVLGLGIPTIALSLLTFVLPVEQTVALLPVALVASNVWQAFQGGFVRETWTRFWPLVAGLAVGLAVGASLLVKVDQQVLLAIAGGSIALFAAAELARFRLRLPARWEGPAGFAAGAVGGVLGGLTTLFGPPIIIYLVSLDLDKDRFVGVIGTVYLLGAVVLTAMLNRVGVFGARELFYSTIAALPLFAGMLLGQWLRHRISQSTFRRALMALLLLMGANLVRRSLFG